MDYFRNMFKGRWSSDIRLDGKTAIITGSNTGIGKETAQDLAQRGARIIMACRDMEKAEAAKKEISESSGNTNILVKRLDLSDTKSIREFAQQIHSEENQVNILINNAGVMMCPYLKTADGFELQFGVNHLGHFLLTYLLIDIIKKSAPARIINVSSMAHKWGNIMFEDINSEKSYDSLKAYSQSKLANVLFSRELAERLKGHGGKTSLLREKLMQTLNFESKESFNINVYSLHPGVVRTELGRHLSSASQFSMKLMRPFTKSSVEGAQTSIYCAVAPELEKETGGYYSDCASTPCSRRGADDQLAKKLWDLSCQLLKITWD